MYAQRFRALRSVELAETSRSIGHLRVFQISLAYSMIVLSLENFPDAAMLRMAFLAHKSRLLAYRNVASSWASA